MHKLLLFLTLLMPSFVFSQSFQGNIQDNTSEPLIGVHVINLSNQAHSHSDDDGDFSLSEVALGDTILFSYIGFLNKKMVVNSLSDAKKIILMPDFVSLDEVVIAPGIEPMQAISEIDLKLAPINSSQDFLQKIPGLFIGQHAGGGKAEQIFLRGFDLDHGTNINITADGMPVNMVSHAHGQGYADLHFLIPELVDKIDFGKGPYHANKGNFTTAGYVDFQTKEKLASSLIRAEVGQFNSKRILSAVSLLDNANQDAYFAAEYLTSDGPFESPQNFKRFNAQASFTQKINKLDKIRFTASHFTSEWDASGQVPVRAIESGLISRFGAIDDTEGGNTSRTNLMLRYDKNIDSKSFLKTTAYYSMYDFELYSNFTFFLNDPVNGDQIRQKENRTIMGLNTEYNRSFSTPTMDGLIQAGLGLRNDESMDNELSRTLNRKETLEQTQLGDVYETNLEAYVGAQLNFGQWAIHPAIRFDHFYFQYTDALAQEYSRASVEQSIVSPKLNFYYNPSKNLQFFLQTGKGFHSNDTRVVVAEAEQKTLPAAYGSDLGFTWKPSQKWMVNTALWYLHLEEEFVYVGDEGIVEPSGQTERKGVDLSVRYQPIDWLYWNADVTYAHARSTEEETGFNFIPLAPNFTFVSGLSIIHPSGISGSIQVRSLHDRPANEDNSIVADGYTLVDLNLNYDWKKIQFGIDVQNVFNAEWKEAQFATESRLQDEPNSVEEIHFTPGAPFFAKGGITYRF